MQFSKVSVPIDITWFSSDYRSPDTTFSYCISLNSVYIGSVAYNSTYLSERAIIGSKVYLECLRGCYESFNTKSLFFLESLSPEHLISTYPVVLYFLVIIVETAEEVVYIVSGSITAIEQSIYIL